MYTQGTDFTTAGTTTNYTTQQYQYQYQYQMPTTTTTTTTQEFTTQPVTFSTTQPVTYTTSQPVTYTTTQQYTVPTTDYTQTYTTQQQTYTLPSTITTSIPTTITTSVPQTYTTQQVYTTTAPQYASPFLPSPVKPQPRFQLLRQGSGISPHEQQAIVTTAMAVYMSGISPISNNTASRIKKTLGGDWIVIVYAQGKPVDFNMTCVQGNDYMYFTLDNTAYQVCRLR